ncbi:urea ABC transporter ATP-binding subunit UrtE [Hirschia baltica]|uniref:ABC transporter related n=1 Tax=Hirschia baltica (strain ATCC 49814 / DSM 5838 / IFAM 1418) TaxID=582402 RepID=C6XQ96_HIRBI|nr:urea ABC transporter ATP-binding subunit UrtE [Hirschia baltica]ACT60395.1 ABC transporter related [Hirschia baltica ATCC 49814]
MSQNPILQLQNLSAAYGQSQVLWDIDLNLLPNQAMGLIGRNGVGKSTLLQTIMGTHKVHGGTVIFDGNDVTSLPAHLRARAGIAIVPQGRHIFPHLTVLENLETGLSARGDRGNGKLPEYIFDLFPKLKDVRSRNGGFLSGGEQQQLAIGRALAGSPKLLLLDEPTEGIQPNVVQQIEAAIHTIKTELKVSVLMVEQRIEVVWNIADQFTAMQEGKIILQDDIANMSAEDASNIVRI